jgi:hypothetical protein
MEAICSSETSVELQRVTLCYIREDRNLHVKCENGILEMFFSVLKT